MSGKPKLFILLIALSMLFGLAQAATAEYPDNPITMQAVFSPGRGYFEILPTLTKTIDIKNGGCQPLVLRAVNLFYITHLKNAKSPNPYFRFES